jgi:hypothetical protein
MYKKLKTLLTENEDFYSTSTNADEALLVSMQTESVGTPPQ